MSSLCNVSQVGIQAIGGHYPSLRRKNLSKCSHTTKQDAPILWSGKGERIRGTTVKDTWTKSRGRVEVGEGGGFSWGVVEGWGGKIYNCN